jgi:hypothetical protein
MLRQETFDENDVHAENDVLLSLTISKITLAGPSCSQGPCRESYNMIR